MENCPHCDAPLKPAATFCLTCDNPVAPETSRLSVGEAVTVSVGRPLVGLAVVAGCLLALGAATYGGVAYVHHQHHQSRQQVLDDVRQGTTLLVDAEGGQSRACHRAGTVLAGLPQDIERECAAIVGDDPGARVVAVSVDRLDLQGAKGTAHVHATIADASGTHVLDRVVDLVHGRREWRMDWSGHREI